MQFLNATSAILEGALIGHLIKKPSNLGETCIRKVVLIGRRMLLQIVMVI